MDEDTAGDQRLPHRRSPNEDCDTATLESLGEGQQVSSERERESQSRSGKEQTRPLLETHGLY